MQIDKNKTVVISLGGSMVIPEEIDVDFLKKFKEFIESYIGRGYKFILITGGGKLCRKYQNAAEQLTNVSSEEKDWIGIYATKLNAILARTMFNQYAHPEINQNPEELEGFIDSDYPVIVASGWKPGWSTDYVAVKLARQFGVKKLANLTNIDYVYTKDPKKFPDAKKLEKITWDEYKKIIGDKWDPGMNAPFDPIASKIADEEGMTVAIINGRKLKRLESFLMDQDFEGTVIHP